MIDPREVKLADLLVNYSVDLKKGEKVLIQMSGSGSETLVSAIIDAVYKAGGLPFIHQTHERIHRKLMMQMTAEQLKLQCESELLIMKEMDAYIGIGAPDNITESSDIPSEKQRLYNMYYSTPLHGEERVKNTKWVVMRYPTAAMAQSASMSQEGFEDYYFNVCTLDYKKMSQAMDPLVELMDKTDKVTIKGTGTDLSFSIKDIPAIKCDGHMNIPDGEVYTAPVKDSVNGTLTYNCPAVYQGVTYENINFTFENGKIVKATANMEEALNAVLDSDEGSRFIGEFAIGVHPFIDFPMKNTLFDEKIKGSFHFTPGRCYDEASNGNMSTIHWDLVCIQTPEYGGGEIYFDGKLIRKDGLFVEESLLCLNPDELSC